MSLNITLPEPVLIMGTPVIPFDSYEHTIRCIEHRILSGEKSFCIAINSEKVYRALADSALREILNESEITICDGVGISIAARILYGITIKRCTGCDLFFHLMEASAKNSWPIFLLGASEESNRLACQKLKQNYPNLQIAGRENGFFEDSDEMISKINASGAKLLFVAMGSPRQECWIAEHRKKIDAPFCMGIGGTLDVISGHAKRAPALFRKTGTEFLYRLISQPTRWRRQTVLPLFFLKVLKEKLF